MSSFIQSSHERIGEILFYMDEAIRTLRQLIEAKQTFNRGLMHNLFSQGIGHSEFKKTRLGLVPKEWKFLKLNDFCEVITKGTTPTSLKFKYTESGINFIKTECVDEFGNIDSTKFAFINEKANRALARSIINLDPGC